MTIEVSKTIKMYVGGEFIRSESGATRPIYTHKGNEFARVCEASRKDFRNAVEKAKAGKHSWSKSTSYLKGQILYRMAEMAQGKFQELQKTLIEIQGLSLKESSTEVQEAIDTFVYYAGWTDKYQQSMSSINPVSAPFQNFTSTENMGVVALIDSSKFSLPKLIDNICSIIVGGNSVVALIGHEGSPFVTTLGEIFNNSDIMPGAINLLSGDINTLKEVIAKHMEVNAISFQNEHFEIYSDIKKNSIDNMKRIIPYKMSKRKSLELILDFIEYKTLWHPIGY